MNEPMGMPPAQAPMTEAPRKSNTGLIIGIVVAVVLCCCCALAAGLWFYGDALLQYMNISI